jgi:replication factor A1
MKAPLWDIFLTEPLIVLREPNEDGQVKVLDVKDLKPGMSRVNLAVKVLKALESIQTVTSGGVEHQILELEVGDKSGSIRLVLWDEKIVSDLKEGDAVKIENGFVTSFKGV